VSFDVLHLYVSPGHNFFGHHGQPAGTHPIEERAEVRCVAGRGLEGDRFLDHKPDYKGQVTFFQHEVYLDLCERLQVWDKPPSVFRRNVITRGVDLNTLIGVEFEVQGIRFLGVEESKPCHWMNLAFGPGAESALAGRGGLRARILSDGILRVTAKVGTNKASEKVSLP
jgi:MOSC domain-containing protein YiiM